MSGNHFDSAFETLELDSGGTIFLVDPENTTVSLKQYRGLTQNTFFRINGKTKEIRCIPKRRVSSYITQIRDSGSKIFLIDINEDAYLVDIINSRANFAGEAWQVSRGGV